MGTSIFDEQSSSKQLGSSSTIIIMKELLQGQEFASQLQLLLKTQSTTSGDLISCFSPATINELLHKISGSFSNAISGLANGGSEEIAVSHGEQQSSAGSGPFEDSVESRKRGSPAAVEKNGAAVRGNRGSYKRRKSGHSRIIVSSSLAQDGHAWRKYGQKEILHAKYPRSYFRCTHKYEQGCKATKQVQQLEQEKEMYSITYLGHHTCRNALKAATPMPNSNQNELSLMADVKQEVSTTTTTTNNNNNNNNEESPSGVTIDDNDDGNTNMWQDLVSFEPVNKYEYDFGNYGYCGGGGGRDGGASDLGFSVNDIDFEGGFRFDPEESCRFF